MVFHNNNQAIKQAIFDNPYINGNDMAEYLIKYPFKFHNFSKKKEHNMVAIAPP